MSSVPVADRKTWFQIAPCAAAVAGAGAVAWAGTVWIVRGMGSMPGTMGVDLPTFAGIWTLMMAAMMLPSIALVAALYARSIASHRIVRLASLSIGYLLAWSIPAPFIYALAALHSAAAQGHETITHVAEAAALIGVTAYQFSPLKDACLRQCRSPIGQVVYLTGLRGRLRDLQTGLRHAAYCIGCCWGLMLVLVMIGTMNIVIMAVVAGAILLEKYLPWPIWPSRAVGLAISAVGFASLWIPQVTTGM